MNQSISIIKNVLLAIVFTVLFLPLLQSSLHLFLVKDLDGFFNKAEGVSLSKQGWTSSEFQEKKELFLNENFGFRNTLIRLNNQLDFLLFKKTSNKETVIGKDNYLFAKTYVESIRGENYIGNDAIIKKAFSVKLLQEKLEKIGKVFLPVIAPNKANFYKEYLPGNTYKLKLTNYEAFKYCFDKLKIKYIDFESYFLSQKTTSKYPLFSKYGIHWSTYGHTLAADSIISYLNINCNLTTNKLLYKDNIVLSDSLRDFDYDIGLGMNLFVDQLSSEPLAYPKYSFKKVSENKPPLLVIGDSFNFGIQKTEMQNEVFSDYKLLYYFKEVVPYGSDKDAFSKLNIKDEINNHQVIMLLFTEQNFVHYGCGFIEKAINILDGFDNGTFDDRENKILEMTKKIINDKPWIDKLTTEAIEKNKNLDTLIRQNAIYMINLLNDEKNIVRTQKINEMCSYIKRDPIWMKSVDQRARENKIPIDTVIFRDAVYQVDLNNK